MPRLLPVFRQSLEIILHPAEHFTQIAFESWSGGHLFQPSDWCVTFERLWIFMDNTLFDTVLTSLISPACFFAGWLHRFHGVRGRSQSGDARKDGAQAALVFQTLWCGRKRLHRPTWAPKHHKGTQYRLLSSCNTAECYRRPRARCDRLILFCSCRRSVRSMGLKIRT